MYMYAWQLLERNLRLRRRKSRPDMQRMRGRLLVTQQHPTMRVVQLELRPRAMRARLIRPSDLRVQLPVGREQLYKLCCGMGRE